MNSHKRTRGTRGTRVETFFNLLLSLTPQGRQHRHEHAHPPRVPREPRVLPRSGIHVQQAHWFPLAVACATAHPIVIHTSNHTAAGTIQRLFLHRDGTIDIRLHTGATISLPSARAAHP